MSKFTREQLIFVVECSLISAMDRIDSGLPHSIEYEVREHPCASLTGYEIGALEAVGMTLAVLYAQLTDDGLGIHDALECTRIDGKQNFLEACEFLIRTSWSDQGEKIKDKIKSFGSSGFEIKSLYGDLWPDTRKYAEAFVTKVFDYQSEDAYLSGTPDETA